MKMLHSKNIKRYITHGLEPPSQLRSRFIPVQLLGLLGESLLLFQQCKILDSNKGEEK